eukprot:TRINITY_DN13888_c0_g1_i2.p1 TRINITY_DN13888_c0_g1~~TRINITY_DN13888_c0_g1_i2.p1  ORF type:complete len:262 (+),score=62.09 TRINITY_DN13888_c0_g1_i2:106-786(+)
MSCLVDYASPPKNKLSNLFQKLILKDSFYKDTVLIYLNDFLFVVNRCLFKEKRELFKLNNNLTFIDINKKNGFPKICSESFITTQILSITQHIETEIQQPDLNIVDLSLDIGFFLITVTGWLLEYPVIYYHSEATDTKKTNWENCLSRIPLQLYTVFVQNREEFEGLESNREHVVMSFSVPNALLNEIPSINIIIHNTFDDRLKRNPQWSHLLVKQEIVSKPQFVF